MRKRGSKGILEARAAQDSDTHWSETDYASVAGVRYRRYTRSSFYLTMRDGVRIAIDLYLPKGLDRDTKVPTVLRQTCYSRAIDFRWPFGLLMHNGPLDLYRRTRKFLVERGYAWLDVDARGSGASSGSRPCPWSPDEIKDAGEIVTWVVNQPWSSGSVGAVGNSYDRTAAEFLLLNDHPAVKAVAPRYSLFDAYTDIAFPGGVHQVWVTEIWERLNKALQRDTFHEAARLYVVPWLQALRSRSEDLGRPLRRLVARMLERGGLPGLVALLTRAVTKGVRPTDEDGGRVLARAAVAEHLLNDDIHAAALKVCSRDDDSLSSSSPDLTIDSFSPHSHVEGLRSSQAAVYSCGGWFDGGYPRAAVKRYLTLGNPGSRLIIGPWDHGGWRNVSPFAAARGSRFPHDAELLRFFDHHLKGLDNGLAVEEPIHYFTLGEGRWKAARSWPPESDTVTYYLSGEGCLSVEQPEAADCDIYRVNSRAGTGGNSRWRAQMGIAGRYPDRSLRDRRLLAYTSEPLDQDVEVTGHPVVNLFVTSTADDGAFFAYLEDVDEQGRVTYVTEGQLRALHRRLAESRTPYEKVVPHHSFRSEDVVPLAPGEPHELVFDLLPTSYLFKRGHSIRLALGGADRDHFAFIPPVETPTLRFHRDRQRPSRIDLPVVRRQ